ncbi:MAG: hypothetical protein LBC88_00630 [Spirochaetaceae bacterium]|nr:hypothetical protein [Spirochaetaceae bacterium]
MKRLARLVLFFTFSFLLTFIFCAGIRYLLYRIDAARMIPALPFAPASALLGAIQMAIPAALHLSVMLSLSYAARKTVPPPAAIMAVFVLSLGFTLGASLGRERLELSLAGGAEEALPTLGKSGLRLRQGDVSIIVLGDPAEGKSPRIVALPGEPLVYMAAPREIRNTPPRLPPVPFEEHPVAVTVSLLADLTLAADHFDSRLRADFYSFLLYLASLCLMLAAFYELFQTTSWPLVNIFIGAAIFRLLLAFETFIDSDAIQNFIFFFLGRFIPHRVISPAIFGLAGLLVILYTALINAGRERRRERYG